MSKKTEVLRFRITPEEIKRLDNIIAQRNKLKAKENSKTKPINRSQVLLSLTRNFVCLGPDFLDDEVLSLKESNRLLLAIGRNLNQVIRKIHSGDITANELTEGYLKKLHDHVDLTKKSINKLVEQNVKRGQTEIGK
ncbi:MAG: hypothetical protein ABW168_11250 [Sedimenticola sp.]